MEYFTFIWAVCVAPCAIIGMIIASRRNATLGGFLIGLVFGPLGVVASFALDGRPKCAKCASRLSSGAETCPYCRTDVERTRHDNRVQRTTTKRIYFNCPHCQEKLSWPAYDAGNMIPCTKCGASTTVPGFNIAAPSLRIRRSQPPSSGSLQPCPDCDKEVSKRAESCPHCGCPLGQS